jgi:hypothetical protein
MLGLMYVVIFPIVAVALYFALPRPYRWTIVFLSVGIWYIGNFTSEQWNNFDSEYTSVICNGTSENNSSYGNTTYLKVKKLKKALDDFGTNNRQRFKRIANYKLFHSLFLRCYTADPSLQLASDYSSSRNFISKDRYFSILTKLTE